MEILTDAFGGCLIIWNIENFHSLEEKVSLNSPKFQVYAKDNDQWNLRIFKFDNSLLNIYLNRKGENNSLNVSISYSCFFEKTIDENSKIKTGLLAFTTSCEEWNLCLLSAFKQGQPMLKNQLKFLCHLRFISDCNPLLNQYRFRSIVETEKRQVKCIIPKNSLESDKMLYISLPSTCKEPFPFEITLTPSKIFSKIDCVYIDLKNVFQNKDNLFLHCGLTAKEEKCKNLLDAAYKHYFTKENKVWRFPKAIYYSEGVSESSSQKDFLHLDFELHISDHTTHTWLEEMTTKSIENTRAEDKIIDKEKINLKDDLLCLYVEKKLPDLHISVNGKVFPAHKAILSARSPVFCAMFENDMIEKNKNVVEIQDLDSDTVDKMLFFMYSEVLHENRWFNVAKLYAAADKYQITTLKDKCSLILKNQLSTQNACEALLLADMHCDLQFLNAVQDFIVSNDDQVFQSDVWKTLENVNPKIACQTIYKAWLQQRKTSIGSF